MLHKNGIVALVIGASCGIGVAIANRLAKDGARVALTHSATADAAATLVDAISGGGLAKAYQVDVRNSD